MKITLRPTKKRVYIPKTRSETFQDRRLKKQKTRSNQVKQAIREYTE